MKDVKDLENAPQYGGILKRCHVVIIDKSQESKLGMSYAKMKSINPDVVYLVVNKGVGEFQMQCNSGMVHEQLNSEQKPTFMEGLILEKVTGYYASASIVASLYKGGGERLEAEYLSSSFQIQQKNSKNVPAEIQATVTLYKISVEINSKAFSFHQLMGGDLIFFSLAYGHQNKI